MRNRTLATAYAVFCTLLLVAGGVVCFAFAWQDGITAMVESIAGLLVGVVLAPIFHELGHVAFAKAVGMELAYVKMFCFAWIRRGKKLRFRMVSPFAPRPSDLHSPGELLETTKVISEIKKNEKKIKKDLTNPSIDAILYHNLAGWSSGSSSGS